MASKQQILEAIRRQSVAPVEHPGVEGPWITYDDAPAQFAAALESVGGLCHFVADLPAVNAALAEIPEFSAAQRIYSSVPEIGGANVDMASIDNPHALDDVDFAVFSGEVAVAENAAVWVTDEHVRHKVVYFLSQHLALVVRRSQLVDNMRQAFEKIEFRAGRFGVFISGPSKTADIEQSLVVGAHGARSLHVFVVE
ncbi:MAG: LUD domain-containing protein [Planctomycetales bacterium]|nr:LUD domain-containing protein [Planctomycetales bacterium]